VFSQNRGLLLRSTIKKNSEIFEKPLFLEAISLTVDHQKLQISNGGSAIKIYIPDARNLETVKYVIR
jgi:hypothetical protein